MLLKRPISQSLQRTISPADCEENVSKLDELRKKVCITKHSSSVRQRIVGDHFMTVLRDGRMKLRRKDQLNSSLQLEEDERTRRPYSERDQQRA